MSAVVKTAFKECFSQRMNIQLNLGGVLMVMTLVDFGGFLARSLLSVAYKSTHFSFSQIYNKKAIKPTS
jgi:hypothetical protein